MEKKKQVIILGAGITGLVSAYYLSDKYKVIVIEKQKFIGGSASCFNYKDFILDYGPHKLYTEIPGIIDEISKIVPLLKIKKKNSIYLKGSYYDFPLKLSQIATRMPFTALKSGIDILLKPFSSKPDNSYENFLINRFGKTLYNLSFKDYAYKVWNSDPMELDAELAKRRVAISGIFQLIKSIILKNNKQISAEYFYYPEKGMSQLFDSLTKKIKKNGGKIITNANISEIKVNNKKIEYIKLGKNKIKSDYIISTIPLDNLLKTVKRNILSTENIKYQKLNIIYFILNKPRALNDCWIFFPEKKFLFQRVSEQKAFSSATGPEDKTAIMVETTQEVNEELIKNIILQLEQAGILNKQQIEDYFVKTIEKAYPLYKKGFIEDLNKIENFFESINNFYLLGRQGLFNYNNMDQCWDMAMKISDQIKNNKSQYDWQETKKYFDNYRIVD